MYCYSFQELNKHLFYWKLCAYVYTCIWVHCPRWPGEGVASPIPGLIGHCKPPDMGAGNQTQSLCKSKDSTTEPSLQSDNTQKGKKIFSVTKTCDFLPPFCMWTSLYLWLCVDMVVHAAVRVQGNSCMCVCQHACGAQRSMLCVFLKHSSSYFFR